MSPSCDCWSYNGQYGNLENKIMKPFFADKEVCIDHCIAPIIQKIWDEGIITLSSCCGHNKMYPSIVFAETSDAVKAKPIIESMDDRRFELKVWLLCDVVIAKKETEGE